MMVKLIIRYVKMKKPVNTEKYKYIAYLEDDLFIASKNDEKLELLI